MSKVKAGIQSLASKLGQAFIDYGVRRAATRLATLGYVYNKETDQYEKVL